MTETATTAMVLNSWKEIAGYVGRGVRTVQRWEADLGMPVRRPRAKSRSAVIAMSDEIDRWLRSAPTTEPYPTPETKTNLTVIRQSLLTHVTLRSECSVLRHQNREALDQLMLNLAEMRRTVGESNPKPNESIPFFRTATLRAS